MSKALDTPMFRQYLSLKAEHKDAFLFFRMGDFYELFFEDAERAAPVLEVVLTSRNRNDPDPHAMSRTRNGCFPLRSPASCIGLRPSICRPTVCLTM